MEMNWISWVLISHDYVVNICAFLAHHFVCQLHFVTSKSVICDCIGFYIVLLGIFFVTISFCNYVYFLALTICDLGINNTFVTHQWRR